MKPTTFRFSREGATETERQHIVLSARPKHPMLRRIIRWGSPMKRSIRPKPAMYLWVVMALGAGQLLMGGAGGAEAPKVDLTEWTPPSIRSLGDDPFGKLVK